MGRYFNNWALEDMIALFEEGYTWDIEDGVVTKVYLEDKSIE